MHIQHSAEEAEWCVGAASASVHPPPHMMLVLGPPAEPGIWLASGVQHVEAM